MNATLKTKIKTCINCGCDRLISLRSLRKRLCPDCKTEMTWELDPGQKPLITSSKDGGFKNIGK